MNRRHFLSLTLTLAGAGIVALSGCGGGGGGGTPLESRRAIVQLPAGVSLALTSLAVEAGQGSAPVDASGGFTVRVPVTDLPSLCMVRDTAGRGVLMGFLPAEGGVLNSRSAAVALLYYTLCGFMLPEASRRPLVALLESDAATVALAGAIDRRMAANPYALEVDDAELNAAVKAAYDTLTAGGRAVRTESFAKQVERTRAESNAMLLVEPGGLQSNVEVTQATGTNVVVTNHSRRYGRVYVYQTGTPNPLPKAILQGAPLLLQSTAAMGIFSTINNLVSGQTAYVPRSTEPISVPLAPNSKKTLYEVIVVGASTNDLPRGFYSDPKYVDEQAKWVTDREDLCTRTWWENLILPTFFEALGIAGTAISTAAVESSLNALKAIEALSVRQLLVRAGQGAMIEAAQDFWVLAAESGSVGQSVRRGLLPLYEAAVGQLAAETAAARAVLFANLVIRAAIAATVLLAAGDVAAVLRDVGSAQPAERWNITVFQPELILDPTEKTIARGQRLTFAVHPPAGLVGTISYAWVTNATFAVLSSASDGVAGRNITTTGTSVDLVTTPSDQGKITVTVTATLTEPGGAKREVGTAQAIVTLSDQATVAGTLISGVKAQDNGFGTPKYHGWVIYTVPVPQGNWTTCQLSGRLANVLHRSSYDQGAPAIDLSPITDFSTWVSYQGSTRSYNISNGVIGFEAERTHGDFSRSEAEARLALILQAEQGSQVIATFS